MQLRPGRKYTDSIKFKSRSGFGIVILTVAVFNSPLLLSAILISHPVINGGILLDILEMGVGGDSSIPVPAAFTVLVFCIIARSDK